MHALIVLVSSEFYICLHFVFKGSTEEHIKQEVNASTAPVLHPSFSNQNLSSHGSESASEPNHNSGAQYSGIEVHHTDIDEVLQQFILSCLSISIYAFLPIVCFFNLSPNTIFK